MKQTNDIATILYALLDTLERLFWDVYLRSVDYSSPIMDDPSESLKRAMHGLSNLKEYVVMQQLPWTLEPMPWSSTNTLKRLASVNTNLHYKLADTVFQMQHLEVLICAYPKLTGTQVVGTPFSRLIKSANEPLTEIVIVLPDNEAGDFHMRAALKLVSEVMESEDAKEEDANRDLLRIANAPAGWSGKLVTGLDDVGPWEQWFLEAVGDGSLWKMERQSWDYYNTGVS